MKIPCSICNQRLEIPDELVGQNIECPACNASLAVPSINTIPSKNPLVEVATTQASAAQKPAPRRKTAAQPKAVSTKKSKSPIPKLAIAAVAIIVLVVVVLVGLGESDPDISIREATEKGNIEAVKQHLAAGTDVNAKDDIGSTSLHWAVYYNHKDIAELLIEKGADMNARNEKGETPLDLEIYFGNSETFDLLRKHGAKTAEELKAERK